MQNENLIQNQIKDASVYVSVWFGQAIVSTRNEKQGGFFDREKKAPNWSTSCSIEGLSFFLFTPSLQRNPGGGRETEIEGENKTSKLKKNNKEKWKERRTERKSYD